MTFKWKDEEKIKILRDQFIEVRGEEKYNAFFYLSKKFSGYFFLHDQFFIFFS